MNVLHPMDLSMAGGWFLVPWFLKCGHWTNTINIPQKIPRNINSQTLSQLFKIKNSKGRFRNYILISLPCDSDI